MDHDDRRRPRETADSEVAKLLSAVACMPKPSAVPLDRIREGAAARKRRRSAVRGGALAVLLTAGVALLCAGPVLPQRENSGAASPRPPATLPAPEGTVVGTGVVDGTSWSLEVRAEAAGARGDRPACRMRLSTRPVGAGVAPGVAGAKGPWFSCPAAPELRLLGKRGERSGFRLLTAEDTGVAGLNVWLGRPTPTAATGRLTLRDGLLPAVPVVDVPGLWGRTYVVAWNPAGRDLAAFEERDADGRTVFSFAFPDLRRPRG
ncbi:hypothetical protein [Streptomyces sp. NPDC101132]|uniref:hypothetical protein n=1 Tax=Streptomyces sp. NPDC101132 TaxID=3366110 RepID=UPI00381AB161